MLTPARTAQSGTHRKFLLITFGESADKFGSYSSRGVIEENWATTRVMKWGTRLARPRHAGRAPPAAPRHPALLKIDGVAPNAKKKWPCKSHLRFRNFDLKWLPGPDSNQRPTG